MTIKGAKFSEEHKRKISEAHKGMKKPWAVGDGRRGKKNTPEHNLSISRNSVTRHITDLTGNIYGGLTVLGRSTMPPRRKGARIQWDCLCECGKMTTIGTSNLNTGNTTSCGCRKRAAIMKVVREKVTGEWGDSSKKSTYYRYLKGAASRELEFALSLSDFQGLVQRDCYYCGCEPSNVTKSPNNNGDFIYNGIDRVDNTKGYLIDNCVPCCKFCNTAKSTLTIDEFVGRLEIILNNIKSKKSFLKLG